jgi:hypothetical protein
MRRRTPLAAAFGLALAPAALAQEPSEVIDSPVGAVGFGFRLTSLGDIDQDGHDDIAVAGRVGRVWVMTGRPFQVSRAISLPQRTIAGLAALDTDGDGVQEVIVAHQSGTQNSEPSVEAFDARTGVLRWSYYDFQFGHEPEIRLANIGDRTGDGVPDLLVGMPSQDYWHPAWWLSSVKLLDGAHGWDGEELISDPRGLGEGVTAAGDLNQDGYADYVVGSRTRITFTSAAASSTGTVYAFSGRTGNYVARVPWVVHGLLVGSELGEDVVSVGDVDGDGRWDFVATEAVGAGFSTLRLRAMSGHDGSTLGTRDFPGEAFPGELDEPELEPFHDIDGDGVHEFVLVVQVSGVHGGPEVRVLSGATLATLHAWSVALQPVPGAPSYTEGALVGDLDHDGSPELLVGRPDAAQGGYVLVLPSRTSVGTATCAAAVANSTGHAATLRLAGSLSVVSDSLQLVGQSIPASTWVLPIAGTIAVNVPAAGGSTGTLCVAGALRRLGHVVARADAGGAYCTHLPLTTWHPGVGGGPPTAASAGETWHFQLWFRDGSPSGPTSNFSTAVEATFE